MGPRKATNLKLCAFYNRSAESVKQEMIALRREIAKSTIMDGDFNILHSVTN